MTEVNLYLENKDKKLKTYHFKEDVTNIDTARMLLFKYVNSFYLNSKYRITVSNQYFEGTRVSEISMIFEKNTELNREFLLRELLK
jgi:hypothetical protein